jgi:hypothetical protein
MIQGNLVNGREDDPTTELWNRAESINKNLTEESPVSLS